MTDFFFKVALALVFVIFKVFTGGGVLRYPFTTGKKRGEGRARAQAWYHTAGKVGLKDVKIETASWSARRFTARAGMQRVSVEEFTIGKNTEGTRVLIEGGAALTLRREAAAAEKAMDHKEVEIGDEGFDQGIYIYGSPVVARAILDVDTRRLLFRVLHPWPGQIEADVVIRDGDVDARLREKEPGQLRGHFTNDLRMLVEVAQRLVLPPDLAQRIAENTRKEPEWRARLQNILLLAHSYSDHPATRATLEQACHDERQDVRLEAALALGGEKGHAVLLELASSESEDDSVAARAIAGLAGKLPLERALIILGNALTGRRIETVRACLELLGRSGNPAVIQPVSNVLAVETGELAVAAVRALGATGVAAAQSFLLPVLSREPAEVRVAAAEALGRVGTADAVLLLQEAGGDHPFDGALRRAVRQSIAEIQSRLSGASPGQLSLADSEAGRLSLVDEDRLGQVSLVTNGSLHDPDRGS